MRSSSSFCPRRIKHAIAKLFAIRPQLWRLVRRTLSHPRRAVLAAILIGGGTALVALVARADESPFMTDSDAAMVKNAATFIDTATNSVKHTTYVGRSPHEAFFTPDEPPTSVALYDQGLSQMLEAAVTGLNPTQPYVLALSPQPDSSGTLEPLAEFTTNAAGAAVVNTLGPIRQIVQGEQDVQRRYLVIVPGSPAQPGAPVQIQAN